MKNVIEKIKTVLRHNQFLTMALIVVIAMSVYLIGCESTTTSVLNPDSEIKVTRAELQQEIEMFKVKMDKATTDLDRQDVFKQQLFSIGVALAQGGTVDPVGAGVTLLGILGIGAIADNRKKDSIIKTLQNGQKTETV